MEFKLLFVLGQIAVELKVGRTSPTQPVRRPSAIFGESISPAGYYRMHLQRYGELAAEAVTPPGRVAAVVSQTWWFFRTVGNMPALHPFVGVLRRSAES